MPAIAAAPKPKGFKTWVAKPDEIKQQWYLVDATGLTLGRMAAKIAMRLMGKDKPTYTPHLDTGDFVVVINAANVGIHPKKKTQKTYRHYSGYLGGLKIETLEEVQAKAPERVVMEAVRRMLPKTLLGKQMLKKLKVYSGSEYPHAAQKPTAWNPLA